MKRPWAFICASEGATSKHLRNYCREVYLLGYLPVCPKLQDSQYLVLEDGRYQNVFLTDGELADLQASFPTVWGQYIEKLSEYMASTGKRYQSHVATIRRWAGEDAKKAAPPTRNRDYSVKEDETV